MDDFKNNRMTCKDFVSLVRSYRRAEEKMKALFKAKKFDDFAYRLAQREVEDLARQVDAAEIDNPAELTTDFPRADYKKLQLSDG